MKWKKVIQDSFVSGMWKITPNCAEMSRLSSQSLDQPLGLMTRIRMRLHYVICVWCRRYSKQVRFVHKAAPELDAKAVQHSKVGLSDEAKKRLKAALKASDAG